MRVIDCLGLAGAPALGAVQAGFDLAAVKSLDGFGTRHLLANRGLLPGPWGVEASKEGRWTPGKAAFVFGCPPCSGFSSVNRSVREGARGVGAPINHCMEKLVAFAASCVGEDGHPGPEVVAFESVQAAGRVGRPLMQQLLADLRGRTGADYSLTHVFMSGASVGAPQVRKRYFATFHRIPFGIVAPAPTRVATYRDAIGDLEDLDPAEPGPQRLTRAPSWYAAPLRAADNLVDSHVRVQTTETRRIEKLAAAGWPAGGSYPNWGSVKAQGILTGFASKYRRIAPDRCGWVVTGFGGVEFVHYDQPRTLTLRELGRLMGFPDAWTFRGGTSVGGTARQIGKQVPVPSTRWLAGWAAAAIRGEPGPDRGARIGKAEWEVDVTDAYKAVYDERRGAAIAPAAMCL